MRRRREFRPGGYLLAGLAGTVAGAALVVAATDAVPRMMAGGMRRMMAEMAGQGCSPAEM
jgi:hypothetical protein